MSTLTELVEQAERELTAASTLRAAKVTEQRGILDAVPAGTSLDEATQARFDALSTEKREATTVIDTLAAKVDTLRSELADDERMTRSAEQRTDTQARTAPAVITSEKRTYTKDTASQEGVSFFSDLYRSQFSGDFQARERIERHQREVVVEGEAKRSVSTGTLNSLVPPVYLTNEAALLARAGRPTANIVRHEQLPSNGMSIIIPRGTTGTTTAVQATQNTNVSNTDIAITDLTIPVVTIAGQQDVSRQALERGNSVDSLIYADLAADYAVKLDAQVLAGTGSAGQMLGILNTAGITQMSAFTAAATITSFYSKLAGAVTAIQSGRFLAPTGVIVHPRRLGWLIAAVDTAGRPLFLPNQNGPTNAVGVNSGPVDTLSSAPAGWIQGIPVYTDAQLPTSVGTGPEDQVIVSRLDDLILWEEGDGSPTELRFEQTTGGSLTTKLVAYGYAAFTAGRYPLSTAIIGGNAGAGFGLVAPTF